MCKYEPRWKGENSTLQSPRWRKLWYAIGPLLNFLCFSLLAKHNFQNCLDFLNCSSQHESRSKLPFCIYVSPQLHCLENVVSDPAIKRLTFMPFLLAERALAEFYNVMVLWNWHGCEGEGLKVEHILDPKMTLVRSQKIDQTQLFPGVKDLLKDIVGFPCECHS